jgi:hypothetical protein
MRDGNRASHPISAEWIFEVSGFFGSVLNQKKWSSRIGLQLEWRTTSKGHPRDIFGVSDLLMAERS